MSVRATIKHRFLAYITLYLLYIVRFMCCESPKRNHKLNLRMTLSINVRCIISGLNCEEIMYYFRSNLVSQELLKRASLRLTIY